MNFSRFCSKSCYLSILFREHLKKEDIQMSLPENLFSLQDRRVYQFTLAFRAFRGNLDFHLRGLEHEIAFSACRGQDLERHALHLQSFQDMVDIIDEILGMRSAYASIDVGDASRFLHIFKIILDLLPRRSYGIVWSCHLNPSLCCACCYLN